MNDFSAPSRRALARCSVSALLALFVAVASSAEAPAIAATTAAATTASKATAGTPFSAGRALGDRRLAEQRASGAGTSVTVDGSLQQNSAVNVQTGTNTIREGSFANALGLTTVIQNSGANVLIQNATTVNVQFK